MLDVFTRKAIKFSIKYILLGEKEIIQMPTPSISSDEFSRVIRSHVESAADNNKAREEKKQRSKKANTSTIISQHKSASCGGGESTGPPQSSSSSSTNTTSTPSVSADSTSKVEDLLNAPMPKTPDEAIDRINKLSAMRDDLLAEQGYATALLLDMPDAMILI